MKTIHDIGNIGTGELTHGSAGLYIFIGEDAKEMSEVFNFKLTNLNDQYVKCGFPIKSFEKYANIIKRLNYDVEIIEPSDSVKYSVKDYSTNIDIINILSEIASFDMDAISPKDSHDILCRVQLKCKNFLEQNHPKN